MVTSLKKEKSRKNTSVLAGAFLAFQPNYWSEMGSNLPHQVVGCWARWPSDLGFLFQLQRVFGDARVQELFFRSRGLEQAVSGESAKET
jgi:hypothetical protein